MPDPVPAQVFPETAAYPQITSPPTGATVALPANVSGTVTTSYPNNTDGYLIILTDCTTGMQSRFVTITIPDPDTAFTILTAGLSAGKYILQVHRQPQQPGDVSHTILITLAPTVSSPPIIT